MRATLYLAVHDQGARTLPPGASRRMVTATEVARALGVPANYLSKTLNHLAKAGVLRSARGSAGGFALAAPAHRISLAQIIAPFVQAGAIPSRSTSCGRTSDEHLDAMAQSHDAPWRQLLAQLEAFFGDTTVADLLATPGTGTDGREPSLPEASASLTPFPVRPTSGLAPARHP